MNRKIIIILILPILSLVIYVFSTNQINDNPYFEHIAQNDIPLNPPQIGEWLYDHKEKGQNLSEYKNTNPIKITPNKNTIYLQPIGDFSPELLRIMDSTRRYVEIFFQTKTVLLSKISEEKFPDSVFRTNGDYDQLLAPYVLNTVLHNKTPKDGIALMAISAKDLYPNKEWNFVFGLASYKDRVGVSSIRRLYEDKITKENYIKCLQRICKISTHEIGHMLFLHHCTYAYCTMNGSNSMYETDLCPNRLCSICQEKIFWNFKYNNNTRLEELISFLRSNQILEDAELLEKDR